MSASRCRARPAASTPFIENDAVLGEVDEHFAGDYLNQETILKAARAAGLLDRDHRQARTGPDLRSHRADRPADHHLRRRDRPARRHSAVRRRGQAPDGGRSFPCRRRDAATTLKSGNSTTPGTTVANLPQQAHLRRCRHQGRAAAVQGTQQAVPDGVLVARSRRHAAQSGRQPGPAGARHQRPDLARRHQERRRQSRQASGGAEGAGAGRRDRRRS